MNYKIFNYFDKDDTSGKTLSFTINGYDLVIGKNVVVGNNFSIIGNKGQTTSVGQDTYIGKNVTIKSGITIGKRNTVLEGTTLDSSTPDDVVVFKNGELVPTESFIKQCIKRQQPVKDKINIALAADDFGRTSEANKGIEYYLAKDVLDHTTLMVNRDTTKEAVDYIHKNKIENRVGIHFNITEVTNVYSVNVKGNFANRLMANKKNQLRLLNEDKELVKNEIRSQLNSYLSYNLKLNYFDSHGHVHFIPSISKVIVPILKEYDVKSVRIPMHNFGKLTIRKRIYNLIFKSRITKKYSRNFEHFDYFIKASCLFNLNDNYIGKTVEIMTHPFAYDDLCVNRRDINFNCIFGYIFDNSDRFNLI